jgi:hypothetical protein
MVCWSCEDCKRNPVIHQQRGYCGTKAFDRTNPFAQPNPEDPKVFEVDGLSIFSSGRGQMITDKYTHCPVGEATRPDGWVQAIYSAYRRSGIALSQDFITSFGSSSEAWVEALEEAHWTAEGIRSLEAEIQIQNRKNGR